MDQPSSTLRKQSIKVVTTTYRFDGEVLSAQILPSVNLTCARSLAKDILLIIWHREGERHMLSTSMLNWGIEASRQVGMDESSSMKEEVE